MFRIPVRKSAVLTESFAFPYLLKPGELNKAPFLNSPYSLVNR